MRAAVLLGEKTTDRVELLEELRAEHAGAAARDALRRALVETLLHGNRAELVETLDETLLGLRPRPATVLAAGVAARRQFRHEVGTDTSHLPGYRRGMDEAEAGARRGSSGSGSSSGATRRRGALLDELRELVVEAEEWARGRGRRARPRGGRRARRATWSQAEEVTPLGARSPNEPMKERAARTRRSRVDGRRTSSLAPQPPPRARRRKPLRRRR